MSKLQDMSKAEILEALDVLLECDAVQSEQIYTNCHEIEDGPDGDKLWEQCKKYRQPLTDYLYRGLEEGWAKFRKGE